jgi:hypothetical protein
LWRNRQVNLLAARSDKESMRVRLLGATIALALATTTAGVTSAFEAAPAQASTTPILFGLIDRWEPQIAADEQQLRAGSGIVGTFLNWSTVKVGPTVNWLSWVRSRGGTPMLDLAPPSTTTLGRIAAGAEDAYLIPFAQAFAAWGHPMLLRVLPEMNGHWEPYAPGKNGQTTAQYRAAFQHIVNVFRGQGATGVKIVWNPSRIFKGSIPLKSLWPGRGYVDWVAGDFYNWRDRLHGTFTPYQLMQPTVHAIRTLTNKPFFVAELGCAPYSGKPTWVTNSLGVARSLGAKAVVWFNEQPGGKGPNWRLDSIPHPATVSTASKAVHGSNVTFAGRASLAAIDRLVTTGAF